MPLEENSKDNKGQSGIRPSVPSGYKKGGKVAAEEAKKATAEAGKEGAKDAFEYLKSLLGELDPKVLGALCGGLIFLLIVVIVVSSVNPSTLFTSQATDIHYIESALKPGFIRKKQQARSYIGNFINSTYNCKSDLSSMSYLQGDNNYTFSSEACEITVSFEPDLKEFAQHIDSHANAVNSPLQFFEDGGSKELTDSENKDPSAPLLNEGADGEFSLSTYGEHLISSYNSEYASNQSEAYFDTLRRYSDDIFDYEKNTGEWTFVNFYMGKKEKEVDVCYALERQPDMTYTRRKVACELPHDIETTEIEYVDAMFGHIDVPMTYDVTMYKKSDLDSCTEHLVGKEMYLPTDVDDVYEKRAVSGHHEAARIVDEVLSNYEMSYLMMYLGDSFGYGYSGLITSNGFNYLSGYEDSSGVIFWAYSQSLNSILHNLPYQTDWNAGGPDMTHQCTQFAATFFYDVYGFAALRGNGSMQAIYLLKDCGRDSACPVKFERAATPAPGAIISLYPNHVVVVDEVDDDGSVYISEGNYNGRGGVRTHQKYSSLSAFCQSTGYSIKAMAIPIKDD